MKLLVYGGKGWIGNQFIQLLNNINYKLGTVRVDNKDKLLAEIAEYQPTHIISFIGRTHGKIDDKVYSTIDYLEQDGKIVDNVRDNLFSPLLLALICKEKNIHFTYLGTGCIFEYDDNHHYESEHNGFVESSLPNFFGSAYSVVKGFTDRLMHQFDNSVLNLRIRMPLVGEDNPRNFITKITKYEKICSIKNSMTVLPELLPVMLDMLKKNVTGTFNLTNPGLVSHNEILEMYKEYVNPFFTWKNFTVEEQNTILASKRSNNFLETNKLTSLYPQIKNIKESVKELLQSYTRCDFPDTKDTKLLVTGGCGFIGSNFINTILKKYQKINLINVDAMYYSAKKENVIPNERYTLIEGNLCSQDLIRHILKTYNINYVVHFAAQSHVQTSFTDSLRYTNDNIVGTHVLLEECRLYNKIKKFIHVSTDEVYGESMLDVSEKHKTEHSILCPTNPYAATKAGAELIAQSYAHSFKMPIIISRGNNVYGPNQYPEKVIPKFIKLLKEDKKITIQGDGSCVRAFLHSYDTATAFIKILESGKIGEIYNIGCDEGMELSILEVAKILIKKIKQTEDYDQWIEYIEDRPYNDKRYYISNDKLKELGWNITVGFNEGINVLI